MYIATQISMSIHRHRDSTDRCTSIKHQQVEITADNWVRTRSNGNATEVRNTWDLYMGIRWDFLREIIPQISGISMGNHPQISGISMENHQQIYGKFQDQNFRD